MSREKVRCWGRVVARVITMVTLLRSDYGALAMTPVLGEND